MRTAALVFLGFAACALAASFSVSSAEDSKALYEFVQFTRMFQKAYASESEMAVAFTNFKNNWKLVQQHAAKDKSAVLSMNEFSDLSFDQFSVRLGTRFSGRAAPLQHAVSSNDLPTAIDWREKNLVVPVKNQGSCGSCWSFSTVVSLEGAHAKATGNLVSLSEQDLVDCVKGVVMAGTNETCCDGCQGGLMGAAFDYMMSKQDSGDESEETYPYKGADGACAFKKENLAATFKNYTAIAQADENALKDAVANVGPVSVGVNADFGWQLYSKGIYKGLFGSGCSSDPSKMNHGVAVVGFGSENGTDFWIVRNSWGATWGESGYMRLAMGSNQCGVANEASYPNV